MARPCQGKALLAIGGSAVCFRQTLAAPIAAVADNP